MEKPTITFKAGPVQASVFMNQRKVEGKKVEIASVSFQKRYQEEGVWKSTSSLNMNDLPKAILALSKAYDFVLGYKSEEGEDEEEASGIETSDN